VSHGFSALGFIWKPRGGDIDILIQADISSSEQIELSQKLTLEFQSHCEEKIDVVVYPKKT
jgi:hypothetical protein